MNPKFGDHSERHYHAEFRLRGLKKNINYFF